MRLRIFAALLLLATALTAQTTDTASIRGTVTDPAGAAVAGAVVTLDNLATGAHRTARSDAHGEYVFAALPVTGSYRIRISGSGFAEATNGPFTLRGGETATFRNTLNAQAVSEAVTVYGTTEGVRADSPELSTRLDQKAMQYIPVFGRKLTSLPLLNSAVRSARGTGDLFLNNTLFVINGGGRRQTTYSIDGTTGDDAWGRQTIFTNIPVAAIQEIDVLTNAFSAEYGRTTGSAVNVVTQSGTNDTRGDVLALWRPKSLQANAPVADVKTGDELQQGSATIGGAVVPDRTHYFLSAEHNDQERGSRITSPVAPGTFFGDFRQTLVMARLDQELGGANHLVVRGNLDRLKDTNPQDVVGGVTLPSAGRTFERTTSAIALSDAMILGADLYNQARLTGDYGSPITRFTPNHPSPQFVRPGVSTEGESRAANLYSHQWQLADTVSWTRGNHYVRAGGDYVRSRSGGNGQEFGAPFVLGQFTFKTSVPATTPNSALTINDVARYTQGFGNATYALTDQLYALFVQDDWRPLAGLTVNLGLRYDRQKLTGDDNNLGPRLGFAWNLDRRTVLRGGYGIFYSQIQSNIDAQWELGGPTGFFNFSVAPGQLGFPTSLAPITSFPSGASLPARDVIIKPGRESFYSQFFDVAKLRFYPSQLNNPRTQQETLGFERELWRQWFVSTDLVYVHTSGIPWNLDANAPAPFVRTAPGQTRSAGAADATRPITPAANAYRRILVTTNRGESKYRGVQLNARRTFSDAGGVMASYTWSHVTNNLESDAPGGDPNDVNCTSCEWADSLLDQTHRGVLTVWRRVPWNIVVGGVATAASGRPFNITTGTDNNGDAANTDRPVINGSVIGRNAGKGTSTFDLSAFVEKDFALAHGLQLALRAEGFNLTNHTNVVGRSGVYGNDPSGAPLPTFGTPLGGVANVDPQREYQFSVRVRY
jgi:outer membrane receptor protein involved in Fe transport